MWHSSILVSVVIQGCAALEGQDGSFLSNHVDKKVFGETIDRAWIASFNEEVSKDRSFWASTWQQLENSLSHLQQSFEKKIGMIQRSSNDPVSDLSADPDVQAALKRLQTDLAQNKNLLEVVNTKHKSDEEQQKEFKAKYIALWHEYDSHMQKDKNDYSDAKKRYANMEAELHSFSTKDQKEKAEAKKRDANMEAELHSFYTKDKQRYTEAKEKFAKVDAELHSFFASSSQQYQSFLQMTSNLMDRESKLINTLLMAAASPKGKDSENLHRSQTNISQFRVAFVDFCRDSLKQVHQIVKDNEKVSFTQLTQPYMDELVKA